MPHTRIARLGLFRVENGTNGPWTRRPIAGTLFGMSCRVLIVEDDDSFAEILELMLAADGRFVVLGRASDGAEGIVLTNELAPDVVTMDIDMPGTDGVEATAAILESDPSRRIVVVSGSIYRDRIDEARNAGAAGYVAKTRVVDELPNVLLAICRGESFVAVE